jgi:hypothetical protein
MKPNIAVFFATAIVIFAAQAILDITIFQITFGFAYETYAWQTLSAAVVACVVSVVFTQFRKNRPAAD